METFKTFWQRLTKIQKFVGSVILVVVLVFILLFSIYSINTSPVSKEKEIVVFEVVEGDNLDSIVLRLEKEGIVKSAFFAKIDAKLHGTEGFIAGQFKIDKSWNTNSIVSYLTDQQNVIIDEVMITFREGIWAKEIAGLLEEKLGVDQNALISLWNDENFLLQCINKYEFLNESILNSEYRIKLEGYLYPETYSFKKDSTLEEITYIFLDHFEKEYEKIKSVISDKGMSIHDLITLASIVQYESFTSEDMKMIAGVFFNRLNANMPLQSSVTVCYAMYEYDDWTECESNTNIDSPYNTYLHNGLPIGPILNPGKDAIEAVLNPKKHDYYYFIADINGTGKVYYSKTLAEHTKLQNELGLSW